MTLTSKLVVATSSAASVIHAACGGGGSSMGSMPLVSNPMSTVNNHHNRDGYRGQNTNLRVVNQL